MKAFVRLMLLLVLIAPGFASAQTGTSTSTTTSKTKVPTCTLRASASAVPYNTKVRLDWASANATSAYLTDVGPITPAKGTAVVIPGKTTTYAASFTGPGGAVTCRVAVVVREGAVVPSGGGGAIDTDLDIDVNKPIDINHPVNLDQPINLGGDSSFPTAQQTSNPQTSSGSSGFLGGIVPAECRGASTIANCDLCSLAQMLMNLANFLLGLSVPAAALLFAWAGILYFSARGNPTQIAKAHSIFKKVIIGFILALSAWVLIVTIMNMLIQGSQLSGWNWKELKCSETRSKRLLNKSLAEYLNSSLPGLQSYTPPKERVSTTAGGRCRDGYEMYNGDCFNAATGDIEKPRATVFCPVGYSQLFDQCMHDETGDVISAIGTGKYKEPTSYSTCYEDDQLVGDTCQGPDGGYPPFTMSNSRTGPEGTCPEGYVYTDDAEYYWCQGPKGADDVLDTLAAGKGGGPIVTCASGDPGCGDITAAMKKYYGSDTSQGPAATEAGNKACAWAVNNVLEMSGISRIDGLSVQSMEAELLNGRGTYVDTQNAQAGDIIVWKGVNAQGRSVSHVGFCENAGCSSALSNSSSGASFDNRSGSTLLGVPGRVYRVNR